MPYYKVLISNTAGKQLDKLPYSVAELLISTIKLLSVNPRPAGYKKLKGREGFRIRKGDYRIIYDINDKILIIDVIAIGHRRNIYD